uniref:Chorion peroxidase n=1 Tax=Cacopsylla melanoneura TaxID=428564 RepID=A0A8D8S818_9HEMI
MPLNERTPLTGSGGDMGPPYIFVSNPNRVYRKQIRDFQCCVCATILLIVLTALVASITYSVDNDDIDVPTNDTNSSAPLVAPNLTLHSLLGMSWPLPEQGEGAWQGPAVTSEQLQQAVIQSRQEIEKINSQVSDGPKLPFDSPSYRHQQSIRTSMQAVQLAQSGILGETATKHISKNAPVKGSIGKGPAFKSCEDDSENVVCQTSPYRTYDGLCNNLQRKSWGSGMKPFKREVAPDYADGISAPRASSDGSPLPSAREVSVTIHRPVYRDDPKFTVMLAVWGQFMDHDVTATALTKGTNGSTITCCGVSKEQQHPACYPVDLRAGDDYYHKYNMTCMEFVRSSPAPACTLGPREQLNQVSSFLDGSVVYGNTEDLANRLRTFQRGELKMFTTPDGRQLLPLSTDPEDGCNEKEQNAKGKYCFMTGDARANENTHLTSMHLLLARQHNTLARQLATLNPDWDDETVYQESRRILAAQMQHVTYNEFLPVLLGPALMTKLKLSPQSSGYSQDYNPNVDPTISNNFATSAFRFAHTLIPGLMKMVANDTSSVEYVELHKMLFNPYEIYSEQGLDKTLQGAMNTNVERADNYFTTQLTQHLFEQVGSKVPYGLDLVSLNIQRGRDHGLPGYPKWRKYCGLSEPKSFDDLKDHVDEESLELLSKTYKTVDDIDMYTGGLSEKPLEGGMLGPTMTCLIANQFVRMKSGDRYWYETGDQPQAFTPAQLDEIRKTSLAGIICQNSDHVLHAQHKVMELVSATNPRVSCVEIPQPDLTQWMVNQKQTLKLSAPNILGNVTKIGSKVLAGKVEGSDGKVLWNGQLPVEIPLPAVSSVGKYQSLEFSGTLKTVSNKSAQFSGQYSHAGAAGNGTFTFDLELFWNYTQSELFTTSGKLDVIFAERGNFSLLSSQLSSVQTESSIVILFGHYVKNSTAFVWAGNSTTILFEPASQPTINSEVTIQTQSVRALQSASLVHENPAFGVSNGHLFITNDLPGNNAVVWSGVTPVAIPVRTAVDLNKTHVFGYMAKFRGEVTGTKLVGNFSIPDYKSGAKPIEGEIALELVQMQFNMPPSSAIESNVDYSVQILFRQSDGNSIVDWATDSHDNTDDGWFLTSGVGDVSKNIAVVLQGVFSPDKTTFSWAGNFIVYSHEGVLTLKSVKDDKSKTDDDKAKAKADDKANKGDVYGAHVSYATVTGGFDGAPAENLLDGPFPAMVYIGDVFTGVAAWMRSIPVTWSGELKDNIITGNYSTAFKGRTLAGTFTANIINTFAFHPYPADLINPNTQYTTTLTMKQFNSLGATMNNEAAVGAGLTLGVGGSTSLQMVGTFSPDATSFYFPGDLTFTKGAIPKPDPDPAPAPNQLKLTASKDGKGDKKKDDKKKKDKDGKKKGESVGVMVKYARITSGQNGTEPEVVFDGKPPLMSYIGNIFAGMPPWQRSLNVLWIGKISGNSISGNYSTVVGGQLYAGSFSADLSPMWVPKLDLSLLKSDAYYSTTTIFTQWGKSSGGFADIAPSKPVDDSALKLFSSAQQLTLGSIDSSVIIVGTFSPDGTSFYWPGSLRFLKTPPADPVGPVPDEIPSSTPSAPVTTAKPDSSTSAPATTSAKPDRTTEEPSNEIINNLTLSLGASLQSKKMYADDVLPGWYKGKLIVKVLGGYVSASLENRPTEQWWYEFLPVDLPTNPFWTPTVASSIAPDNATVFSHGIIWSATDIGEYNIQGTFSMPQYVRSNGELYSVQWYNGQFNFRFSPLWNSLMNQFVEPNVKYYSPLHFQSTSNPILQAGPSQDVINSATPAPIILLGDVTPEKFTWSGSSIIIFK